MKCVCKTEGCGAPLRLCEIEVSGIDYELDPETGAVEGPGDPCPDTETTHSLVVCTAVAMHLTGWLGRPNGQAPVEDTSSDGFLETAQKAAQIKLVYIDGIRELEALYNTQGSHEKAIDAVLYPKLEKQS